MNPLQLHKCLADETRLHCVTLIALEGELCVCELTEALAESQPKISRHLAQLRQCGILADRRQGKWVFYRLNASLPDWCKTIVHQTAGANAEFVQARLNNLARMQSRPDRPGRCA